MPESTGSQPDRPRSDTGKVATLDLGATGPLGAAEALTRCSDGSWLIVPEGGSALLHFSPSGEFLGDLAPHFDSLPGRLRGLALHGDRLFACDAVRRCVYQLCLPGEGGDIETGPTIRHDDLIEPVAVNVDDEGWVQVLDRFSSELFMFSADGDLRRRRGQAGGRDTLPWREQIRFGLHWLDEKETQARLAFPVGFALCGEDVWIANADTIAVLSGSEIIVRRAVLSGACDRGIVNLDRWCCCLDELTDTPVLLDHKTLRAWRFTGAVDGIGRTVTGQLALLRGASVRIIEEEDLRAVFPNPEPESKSERATLAISEDLSRAGVTALVRSAIRDLAAGNEPVIDVVQIADALRATILQAIDYYAANMQCNEFLVTGLHAKAYWPYLLLNAIGSLQTVLMQEAVIHNLKNFDRCAARGEALFLAAAFEHDADPGARLRDRLGAGLLDTLAAAARDTWQQRSESLSLLATGRFTEQEAEDKTTVFLANASCRFSIATQAAVLFSDWSRALTPKPDLDPGEQTPSAATAAGDAQSNPERSRTLNTLSREAEQAIAGLLLKREEGVIRPAAAGAYWRFVSLAETRGSDCGLHLQGLTEPTVKCLAALRRQIEAMDQPVTEEAKPVRPPASFTLLIGDTASQGFAAASDREALAAALYLCAEEGIGGLVRQLGEAMALRARTSKPVRKLFSALRLLVSDETGERLQLHDPTDAPATTDLAGTLLAAGMYHHAATLLRDACRIDPGLSTRSRYAAALALSGEREAAARIRADLFDCFNLLPEQAADQFDPEEWWHASAVSRLGLVRQARLHPADAAGGLALIRSLRERGLFVRALDLCTVRRTYLPGDADLLTQQVHCLFALNRSHEARALLDAEASRIPDPLLLAELHLLAAFRLGDEAESETQALRAVAAGAHATNPDFVRARFALRFRGDRDEAERLLEEPTLPRGQRNALAELLIQNLLAAGDREKTTEILRRLWRELGATVLTANLTAEKMLLEGNHREAYRFCVLAAAAGYVSPRLAGVRAIARARIGHSGPARTELASQLFLQPPTHYSFMRSLNYAELIFENPSPEDREFISILIREGGNTSFGNPLLMLVRDEDCNAAMPADDDEWGRILHDYCGALARFRNGDVSGALDRLARHGGNPVCRRMRDRLRVQGAEGQ